MQKILIKGGTIVNSWGKEKADVLIEGDKIISINKTIKEDNTLKVIDAANKYVIPGGIDPHVHFHLKTGMGYSTDDFSTGSKAAIAGGTTTIIDFVTPEKKQSLIEALNQRKEEAKPCLCNYTFHVTPITWNGSIEKEMQYCYENEGITSFKVYMAYKGAIGVDNNQLKKVLEKASQLNAVVAIHAEDGDYIEKLRNKFLKEKKVSPKYHALSRPAIAEAKAVKTAIKLAEETKASVYFVHISAKESVELIKKAQATGLSIFGETCPQYLLFDSEKLNNNFYASAPFVFSPALHENNHKLKLWEGLQRNFLQTVGTDHCPFNLEGQKDLGINDFTKIPNGTGGVEHRLELLYTFGVLEKKITLEKMVELVSHNPAKIFGLVSKGQISEGYDADIVIWNPNIQRTISVDTHFQNCDNNIYSGLKTKGKAEIVIINGEVALYDNNFFTSAGIFLKR